MPEIGETTMKKKLSIVNDKPSFKARCTYGFNGDWELHVFTSPKTTPRGRFDKECAPGAPVEDLGKVSIQAVADRMGICIGKALGSMEEPSAELGQLLAPNFNNARVLVDDGKKILITAETGREFFLFKFSRR